GAGGDAPDLLDHALDPEIEELIDGNDPHAGLKGEGHILIAETGPADADLQAALRVDQTFLDGAAERGAVVVLLAVETLVGVGMAVEVDEAQRPVLGDGAQYRQAHQMVAADRQRHGAGPM